MIMPKTPQRTTQGEWEARWELIKGAPRVIVLAVLILLVFGIFGQRLWYLQFVQGEYYSALADWQRLKPVSIPAARGIIYARDGTPLVRNVPSFKVVVIPAELPDDEEEEAAVLIRLAVLLDVPYTTAGSGNDDEAEPRLGLKEMVDAVRGMYHPLVVKRGVKRDVALLVAQERLTLPGVHVERDAIREYTYGLLVSQVLGYVMPIPEGYKEEDAAQGYDLEADRVGFAGIEYSYEDHLRGEKGSQLVEEDVLGRVIRVVEQEAEPIPGHNVYLTLDLDLQQTTEGILRRGMERAGSPRGVAVVMNPQTGEILAMVSLPTYDNNLFVQGIPLRDWDRMIEDDHRPLLNHAIADLLQPGSTFKIVVATGALQEGVLDGRDTHLNCPGTIVIPNKYYPNDPGQATSFYCWNRSGHGRLDVVGGIANSCNIFFYKVGGGFEEDEFEGLGPERLARYAKLFGFGEPTEVELTGEVKGLVPDPDWKRLTTGESWATGDTYLFSIGEGYLQVTPLQMLNAVNVVANGGMLYRPQIVHHVTDADGNVLEPFEPQVIRTLPITPTNWSLVQQGMEEAVAYGTATRGQVEGVRVAGKTGTAQYCDDIAVKAGLCAGTWPEHAWFTAFAPVEAPEVSVIVFLYNGGEGSVYAVPVAQEILAYYFGRQQAVVP